TAHVSLPHTYHLPHHIQALPSLCIFFCYFFFSSRRRHTRSLRDWSSDVCSSDLKKTGAFALGFSADLARRPVFFVSPAGSSSARSEERRVGKECRSRWWPDH